MSTNQNTRYLLGLYGIDVERDNWKNYLSYYFYHCQFYSLVPRVVYKCSKNLHQQDTSVAFGISLFGIKDINCLVTGYMTFSSLNRRPTCK